MWTAFYVFLTVLGLLVLGLFLGLLNYNRKQHKLAMNVVAALRESGPATPQNLMHRLHLHPNDMFPLLQEMTQAGMLNQTYPDRNGMVHYAIRTET